MYVQYNRKATSNNPLMDKTAASGHKVLKSLFWFMICPLVQLFLLSLRKRTPPVRGHLPLVPGVPTHVRFDYIHQIIIVIYFMWCVKGCLSAAVLDNCACAILEVLTPVQRLQR